MTSKSHQTFKPNTMYILINFEFISKTTKPPENKQAPTNKAHKIKKQNEQKSRRNNIAKSKKMINNKYKNNKSKYKYVEVKGTNMWSVGALRILRIKVDENRRIQNKNTKKHKSKTGNKQKTHIENSHGMKTNKQKRTTTKRIQCKQITSTNKSKSKSRIQIQLTKQVKSSKLVIKKTKKQQPKNQTQKPYRPYKRQRQPKMNKRTRKVYANNASGDKSDATQPLTPTQRPGKKRRLPNSKLRTNKHNKNNTTTQPQMTQLAQSQSTPPPNPKKKPKFNLRENDETPLTPIQTKKLEQAYSKYQNKEIVIEPDPNSTKPNSIQGWMQQMFDEPEQNTANTIMHERNQEKLRKNQQNAPKQKRPVTIRHDRRFSMQLNRQTNDEKAVYVGDINGKLNKQTDEFIVDVQIANAIISVLDEKDNTEQALDILGSFKKEAINHKNYTMGTKRMELLIRIEGPVFLSNSKIDALIANIEPIPNNSKSAKLVEITKTHFHSNVGEIINREVGAVMIPTPEFAQIIQRTLDAAKMEMPLVTNATYKGMACIIKLSEQFDKRANVRIRIEAENLSQHNRQKLEQRIYASIKNKVYSSAVGELLDCIQQGKLNANFEQLCYYTHTNQSDPAVTQNWKTKELRENIPKEFRELVGMKQLTELHTNEAMTNNCHLIFGKKNKEIEKAINAICPIQSDIKVNFPNSNIQNGLNPNTIIMHTNNPLLYEGFTQGMEYNPNYIGLNQKFMTNTLMIVGKKAKCYQAPASTLLRLATKGPIAPCIQCGKSHEVKECIHIIKKTTESINNAKANDPTLNDKEARAQYKIISCNQCRQMVQAKNLQDHNCSGQYLHPITKEVISTKNRNKIDNYYNRAIVMIANNWIIYKLRANESENWRNMNPAKEIDMRIWHNTMDYKNKFGHLTLSEMLAFGHITKGDKGYEMDMDKIYHHLNREEEWKNEQKNNSFTYKWRATVNKAKQ